MSGLLLLGVIGIWVAIVVFVAKWLARRFKPGAVRNIVVAMATVVMLALPVADELISAPQFNKLCEEGAKLKFDPKTIYGMTVYRQPSKFPFPEFRIVGLVGYYIEAIYTDQPVGAPVISSKSYSIKGGVLIRALGISETTAPLTFKGSCRPLEVPYQQPFLTRHKLTIIEIKDSK